MFTFKTFFPFRLQNYFVERKIESRWEYFEQKLSLSLILNDLRYTISELNRFFKKNCTEMKGYGTRIIGKIEEVPMICPWFQLHRLPDSTTVATVSVRSTAPSPPTWPSTMNYRTESRREPWLWVRYPGVSINDRFIFQYQDLGLVANDFFCGYAIDITSKSMHIYLPNTDFAALQCRNQLNLRMKEGG